MTRLERTAFHESGHCVMAFALDHHVMSATVVPAGDTLGSYCIRFSRRRVDTPHHRLLVTLAGPMASAMHRHGVEHEFMEMIPDRRRGCDWRQAVEAAAMKHPHGADADPEEIAAIIRAASWEARKILATPNIWGAVTRIANALLIHKTLTGESIERLILAPQLTTKY